MASSTQFDARADRPHINSDLQDVANGIHQEFDKHLDPVSVDECVLRVAGRFNDASVRAFVPLLVGRYVREELHGLLTSA